MEKRVKRAVWVILCLLQAVLLLGAVLFVLSLPNLGWQTQTVSVMSDTPGIGARAVTLESYMPKCGLLCDKAAAENADNLRARSEAINSDYARLYAFGAGTTNDGVQQTLQEKTRETLHYTLSNQYNDTVWDVWLYFDGGVPCALVQSSAEVER